MTDIYTATASTRALWNQRISTSNSVQVNEGDSNNFLTFTSGTGVGQINKIWFTGGNIPSGSILSIDCSTLKTDFLGSISTIDLTNGLLKGLNIRNLSTGSNNYFRCDFSGSNSLKTPFNNSQVTLNIPGESSIGLANKFGWTIDSSNKIINLVDVNSTSPSVEVTIFASK